MRRRRSGTQQLENLRSLSVDKEKPLIAPEFTLSPSILAEVSDVEGKAATFHALAKHSEAANGWNDATSPVAHVQVWRKKKCEWYGGAVMPYKSTGILPGVSAEVLMAFMMDVHTKRSLPEILKEIGKQEKSQKSEVIVVPR